MFISFVEPANTLDNIPTTQTQSPELLDSSSSESDESESDSEGVVEEGTDENIVLIGEVEWQLEDFLYFVMYKLTNKKCS